MSIISKGYDWGPANYRLVINVKEQISGDINKEKFTVQGLKKVINFETMKAEKLIGEVSILSAYVSNKFGEIVNIGEYITLELVVHPDSSLTSPYTFNLETYQNIKDQVKYKVFLNENLILNKIVEKFTCETDNKTETVFEEIENFELYDFTYKDKQFGNIELKYGLFTPEEKKNKPLIILFHGAGEGGNDVSIALLGNKVMALTKEDIQSYFDDAYILVPQTSTIWMDNGNGEYTKNGTSKYTEAVISMIEHVINSNPEIDNNRVYVGGGSNGGFMTMKMILTKPELFAAAFPICQAYESEWVTDEQVEKLKSIPIWFTHSTNDPVVMFQTTTKALYNRLIESGHSNIHLSALNGVFDNTGIYINAEESPYQYNGHWSWIPVFNNEINDRDHNIYSWLAIQRKDFLEPLN